MMWSVSLNFDGNVVEDQSMWGQSGAFTTIGIYSVQKLSDAPFLNDHLDRVIRHRQSFFKDEKLTRKILFSFLGKFEEKIVKAIPVLLRISISKDHIQFSTRPWIVKDTPLQGIPVKLNRPYPVLKSLYYKEVLALVEKVDSSKSEIILLDDEGYLQEGAFTNIWCIKNDHIYLPEGPSLNGITQSTLLGQSSVPIAKKKIHWDEIHSFSEVLLLGSGRGVRAMKGDGATLSVNGPAFNDWRRVYHSLFLKRDN